MTAIKNLKNNPQNTCNLIDILSLLINNDKTKYIELISRLLINDVKNSAEIIGKETESTFQMLCIILLENHFKQQYNLTFHDINSFIQFNEKGLKTVNVKFTQN